MNNVPVFVGCTGFKSIFFNVLYICKLAYIKSNDSRYRWQRLIDIIKPVSCFLLVIEEKISFVSFIPSTICSLKDIQTSPDINSTQYPEYRQILRLAFLCSYL